MGKTVDRPFWGSGVWDPVRRNLQSRERKGWKRGVGIATGGLGKRMQASPWVADRLEGGHGGLGQRMDGSTLGLVDGDDRWGEGEEDACHGHERQAPEGVDRRLKGKQHSKTLPY